MDIVAVLVALAIGAVAGGLAFSVEGAGFGLLVALVVLVLTTPILAGKIAVAESMTPWERATSTPKGELNCARHG